MAGTIFMAERDSPTYDERSKDDYDEFKVNAIVGKAQFKVLELLTESKMRLQCPCGNECIRTISQIGLVSSCGKCKTRSQLVFQSERYKKPHTCRYYKDQCELLLKFWTDIIKFNDNAYDDSIQFPVIHGREGHSVMILDRGTIVKEIVVSSIVKDKQRIEAFIR